MSKSSSAMVGVPSDLSRIYGHDNYLLQFLHKQNSTDLPTEFVLNNSFVNKIAVRGFAQLQNKCYIGDN